MTIRLRGHHLLCMLTFKGHGYTAAFTANFKTVLARIDAGEKVELVAGPDDLCHPRLGDASDSDVHCRLPRIDRRDRLALQAVGGLLDRPLRPGSSVEITAPMVEALRHAFREGAIRSGCFDCQWADFCTGIAAEGYADTALKGADC